MSDYSGTSTSTSTESMISSALDTKPKKSTKTQPLIVVEKQNSLEDSHRHVFNKSVFKCVSARDSYIFPENNNKYQQFNKSQYNHIIDTLNKWDNNDKEVKSLFWKQNHNGYHGHKQFVVVKSEQSDNTIQYKLHRLKNSTVGRLCLPMNEICDAIKDALYGLLAHLKASPTHKAVQKKM